MPAFSERLKAERARLRLSQAEMAEAGGVSLNSQSNYENGHRSPDAAYLERVAALGVDVSYLLTGARPAAPPKALFVVSEGESDKKLVEAIARYITQEEAALLDNYEAADEQGRAAARRVLDALAKQKAA